MPGLVRKVVIYAGRDGLVLVPHSTDFCHSITIEYKSQKVSTPDNIGHSYDEDDAHLETHGIIGLINIASLSFLLAITKREQVAQVFGKQVYVIGDIAILPLSSRSEALAAIVAATQNQSGHDETTDEESSDSEGDDDPAPKSDVASSPAEDEGPYFHKNKSNTSIAEDVAKRKAMFGKFASQWFSKQVWGTTKRQSVESNTSISDADADADDMGTHHTRSTSEAAETNQETLEESAEKGEVASASPLVVNASALSLLPKILRSVKLILSSRSFYFAYDFDLTRRFALNERRPQPVNRDKMNPLYFWNRRMGSLLADAGHGAYLVPIVQGFVGQRTFSVKQSTTNQMTDGTAPVEAEHSPSLTSQSPGSQSERHYLLTLISRRSVKRSGLRYLRRGIDDEGNCANSVETEQILSSPTWDLDSTIRSFTQLRGSIPLYFSQSPYSLKPAPMFHNTPSANETAFRRHFEDLQNQYGEIQIAALVDKHGTEATIGGAYERLYRQSQDKGQLKGVDFEWFDFHHECRGMKFENVQLLVDKMQSNIAKWGETVVGENGVQKKQEGIIRTNCMDCLDRTNVAQSAFGQHVLQRDLREDGYDIDLLHDTSTNWFNILWADNGDAISRQYASTAALKGDFTRTRKRNWRGQMNDLGLTLSRYYSNMVNDYLSQAVIDLLLANVSWKVFEDFESSMMSADPGISVESARETAIENCAKIVIQRTQEDLIHGWTLLSPAQANTLRTLPFEETVVLLTDAAVYCCKFDWNTEKVASFEKVDLRSISKIRLGTYITSTFTERQLDESLNQGLVIVYTSGKGSVIRVNTRSLQNLEKVESQPQSTADGGTGILSWFAPKGQSQTSRTLALKVIVRSSTSEAEDTRSAKRRESPHETASQISEEIKRAIIGSDAAQSHSDLVEVGDIISAVDAKKRTGYLEQLGHSIKKLVWA